MPITYVAGTNLITVTYVAGDAKGDSYANPYTLDDIVDKSVAEAWGIASKQGVFQWYIEACILITGTNTFFWAKEGQCYINPTATLPAAGRALEVSGSANFRSGDVANVNQSLHTGFQWHGKGDNVYWLTLNARVEVHKSVFSRFQYIRHGGTADFTSIFQDVTYIQCNQAVVYENDNIQIRRIQVISCSNAITTIQVVDAEDVTLIDNNFGFRLSPSSDQTLTFVKYNFINTITADVMVSRVRSNSNFIFVDSVVDKNKLRFLAQSADAGTCSIRLRGTLKVYSEDGATLELYDKDGNVIALTEDTIVSGMAENIVEYYYETGVAVVDSTVVTVTKTTLEPFRLVVKKEGCETYEVNDLYLTDDDVGKMQPTTVRANLKTAVPVMITNEGIAIKANKENFGKNRELAIMP